MINCRPHTSHCVFSFCKMSTQQIFLNEGKETAFSVTTLIKVTLGTLQATEGKMLHLMFFLDIICMCVHMYLFLSLLFGVLQQQRFSMFLVVGSLTAV